VSAPPPPPDDKAHSHAQADANADAEKINGDAHAEVPRARFASAAEYAPLALTGKPLRPLPGAKAVLAPRWHSRIGRGPATATDRGYKPVARRPARPRPAPGIGVGVGQPTVAQDGAQAGSDTSDSDTSDGEPDDVGMEEPGSAGDRLGTAAPLELNRSGNRQPMQPILQTLR
jgi:hypothetical protein